jgi:hypothetical protein
VSDIAAQGHRDNRLLAAMPPDAFALLERDLDQVSLKHGALNRANQSAPSTSRKVVSFRLRSSSEMAVA